MAEGFYPYIGGVETRYTELGTRLGKKHEVHVFTLRQKQYFGYAVPKEENNGLLHIHRVMDGDNYFVPNGGRDFRKVLSFVNKCLSKMKDMRFDSIILSEWPLLHIPPVALLNHCKCIVDWHEVWGSLYFKYGFSGYPAYLIEGILPRLKSLKHIAISKFTRDRLLRIFKIGQVPIVSNGVNLEEFDNVPENREWGKVVFFGRFVPHKNIPLLFKAKEILHERGINIKLDIIGDGPMRPVIEQMAEKLNAVTVHDPLPRKELIKHLKSAWIATIPSIREGQGIAFIEAMASKTPLISAKSPYSAAEELISNGKNGFVVTPDPVSLANCMEQLLEDKTLWKRISDAGYETSKLYDWQESVNTLEKILKN